jgi:hypothetical protein
MSNHQMRPLPQQITLITLKYKVLKITQAFYYQSDNFYNQWRKSTPIHYVEDTSLG